MELHKENGGCGWLVGDFVRCQYDGLCGVV